MTPFKNIVVCHGSISNLVKTVNAKCDAVKGKVTLPRDLIDASCTERDKLKVECDPQTKNLTLTRVDNTATRKVGYIIVNDTYSDLREQADSEAMRTVSDIFGTEVKIERMRAFMQRTLNFDQVEVVHHLDR
jgi:hypothetical protein